MQDSYYNHILENIIHVLRNMKPMFGENMVEYQQLQVKDYDQIMPQAEALNSYNIGSKRNKLMEYFSKSLFPVLKSAEFKKSFLKKIYLIKIDSFDLRIILDKCESLMA